MTSKTKNPPPENVGGYRVVPHADGGAELLDQNGQGMGRFDDPDLVAGTINFLNRYRCLPAPASRYSDNPAKRGGSL